MTVAGSRFENQGYDPSQRAFVLRDVSADSASIRLNFNANADSPLLNPAIVVENWGEATPSLVVNGKPVEWGKDARFGLVDTLDRSTLIVWLRLHAESETSIELRQAASQAK
jgi:hypothetical protein